MVHLANDLSQLTPIQDKIKLDNQYVKYYESYILTDAIQSYIEKSQHYLQQEKAFFATASHELRTPISVVSGAIEVIQHHQDMTPALKPHVDRVARVVDDMEQLIACLLLLARDQQRLQGYAEKIDITAEIPSIIENNLVLCEGKQLDIVNLMNQSLNVSAPPQLLKIIIANLLRNAIENSDCGTIKIYQDQQRFMIEDCGHGMSAEELRAFYTLKARAGNNPSAGIGIPLILKICEHFGWSLVFQSKPEKGTIAVLSFEL